MAGKGHEERFPPVILSDRFGFREGTFARTRGNDEGARMPDLSRPRHGTGRFDPTVIKIEAGRFDLWADSP
jgi:hypothetical protein